ncbi:hypothetical protein Tco_0659095 [Tanacetum coccineum]
MASNPENVRLTVLMKLQEAIDEEAILEEQILALMHRFADRFTDRRVEINNLMVLQDHALVDYGKYALGCMTGADMKKCVYLKSVRDELLRSMEEKCQLMANYRDINSSATSAWLLSHVTPFVPHVRISSISLGNNVTDANLLKLLLSGIDNVKEKVKGLGIKGVKVSTTVSLAFVNSKDIVAKELLGGLSEKDATLFVNVKHWNVSLGPFKEVVCGGFALKRDLSADVGYVSLDNNGEMMDYRVVEVRVLKVEEDKVKKDDDVDAILFLLILYYWNGKLLKLILHYGSVDPLGRLRSTCSGGVVPHQSACSFRHNVDEIKAMVQKQIEEVKVRQLAILNLAVEYDNACTAKDLLNAYEKYTDRKNVF